MNDETEKLDESLQSLIEAVVNGEASADQHRLLEQRLLDDKQARDAWLNYTNLHASLNRWYLASDPAEPLDDDIVDLPLTMSRESLEKSKARRSYIGWMGLIVAVCLLVVVGVYQLPWLRSLIETPIAESPTIVKLAGNIQIQSTDGRAFEATASHTVQPGETVVSNSDEDSVVLRYSDGTEIVLLGPSALTIAGSTGVGKELKLRNGLLRAKVTPQPSNAPLLIVTPQARVRVLGTRFELSTDQQDGTRLDLESGEVELVRGDERPVKVKPNSIAIVPTTADPIRVSRRPAVVDIPQRETVFRGLKSVAFAEDGKAIIASTKWQALYWYEDDRLEVIPLGVGRALPPVSDRVTGKSARPMNSSQGISFRQQANSLMAYFDHNESKLNIWDARSRQSRTVFDDIAELRRQFPASVNRPKDWNPASEVAVVSPQGDWLVFQVSREFRVWRTGKDHWPEFPRNYDGRFVGALASSPDGNTLAIAVRRGKIDLVDVNTGEVTTTWPLRGEVPFAMEFSADGQYLAVGLAGHVAVHHAATGDVLADFKQPGLPFLKVAISADGRFVAASSLGERVWMWDVTGGVKLPLLDIGGSIGDMAFSRSGDRLAVLSRGGRLNVWDVVKSKTRISQSGTNPIGNDQNANQE